MPSAKHEAETGGLVAIQAPKSCLGLKNFMVQFYALGKLFLALVTENNRTVCQMDQRTNFVLIKKNQKLILRNQKKAEIRLKMEISSLETDISFRMALPI